MSDLVGGERPYTWDSALVKESPGEHRRKVLERVVVVLARLVRDEYPDNYSLAEIAERWGGASKEDLEAVIEWEL
jgi:hypothetical protein